MRRGGGEKTRPIGRITLYVNGVSNEGPGRRRRRRRRAPCRSREPIAAVNAGANGNNGDDNNTCRSKTKRINKNVGEKADVFSLPCKFTRYYVYARSIPPRAIKITNQGYPRTRGRAPCPGRHRKSAARTSKPGRSDENRFTGRLERRFSCVSSVFLIDFIWYARRDTSRTAFVDEIHNGLSRIRYDVLVRVYNLLYRSY